jgi:hypothetical protein
LGGTPLIGTTSFATLRRYIGAVATIQHNSKIFCLNNAVCWDDISPALMRNEHTFSLIKSATNRATSIYRMPKSQTDTEMLEIQTFGQRVLSSIYPFFVDPEFVELNRRMLIVECKKSENAADALDFETISWDGLKLATNNYWTSKASEYAVTRKKVVKFNRSNRTISPERFALCTDLLTAGMVLGVWSELATAVEALRLFYASNDNLIATFSSPLKMVLLRTLQASGKNEIATNIIKDVVTTAVKSGLIDRTVRPGDTTQMMRSLGWDLSVIDRVWRKVE